MKSLYHSPQLFVGSSMMLGRVYVKKIIDQSRSAVRRFSTPAAAVAEAPALIRTYGGLKDQDRIFTNLYVRSLLVVVEVYL